MIKGLALQPHPIEPMMADTSWRTVEILIRLGLVRERRRFGWTCRMVVITDKGRELADTLTDKPVMNLTCARLERRYANKSER